MPRYLAIDADANGLFVASANVGRGSVKIEKTLAWVEDGRPLSASTAKALGAKLKELLKQAGIAAAPALVCLGRDRVILKDVHFPPTPPADEPAVVRFQAMKELTESPEEVAVDYYPHPAVRGATDRQATVVFLRRDILGAARVMCEAAGLKLAGVTPRPYAAVAAATRAIAGGTLPPPESVESSVAILSLTERGGEFTVLRGGQVRFSRGLTSAAMASEGALVPELRRNLTVAAGQVGGGDIDAIYLAEADSGGAGWYARLRAGLPVPVYPFDPLANAPGAETIPAPLRGRFIGPIGLLALQAAGTLPINFAQPRQPRSEANPQRSRHVLAGVLGGVALLALAGGAYYFVDRADSKAVEARKALSDLEARITAGELDVKRLEAADAFTNSEVVWLDELYDLSDRFPDVDKMRITKFSGSALPPTSERDRLKEEAAAKAQNIPLSKLPVKPVAKLTLTVTAENGELPEKLIASLESKYYSGTKKSGGQAVGTAGSKGSAQSYTIDTQLSHRKPEDYRRRLTAKVPVLPTPAAVVPGKVADPDDAGFGGGFP